MKHVVIIHYVMVKSLNKCKVAVYICLVTTLNIITLHTSALFSNSELNFWQIKHICLLSLSIFHHCGYGSNIHIIIRSTKQFVHTRTYLISEFNERINNDSIDNVDANNCYYDVECHFKDDHSNSKLFKVIWQPWCL